MVELFLRWHKASEGGLWSVEGGEQKRVLGRTRDVPETLSLRPAEEGGTSKATANQGELAVGPCFDGGVSLVGLCAKQESGTASSSSCGLACLALDGFTQKYQFARRAVELIGLENQMLDFQMMHA